MAGQDLAAKLYLGTAENRATADFLEKVFLALVAIRVAEFLVGRVTLEKQFRAIAVTQANLFLDSQGIVEAEFLAGLGHRALVEILQAVIAAILALAYLVIVELQFRATAVILANLFQGSQVILDILVQALADIQEQQFRALADIVEVEFRATAVFQELL